MLPLAACGNKAVATTSGGKITQSEYYSSMKATSNGKQVLQQMILDKVLEKEYGKQVSDIRSMPSTTATSPSTAPSSAPSCSKMG